LPQQEISGIALEKEQARATSYGLGLAYVPKPAAPLFLSRAELALEAGVNYNALEINGELTGFFVSPSPASFAINKKALGAYLAGEADFYPMKSFSLQFKIQGRVIPKVEVPVQIHTLDTNPSGPKTLQAHAVNFSGVEVAFGMRAHF
jgi:hypothetical protein